MTQKQKQQMLPGIAPVLLIGSYFAISIARGTGWVTQGWSLLPVIETAWLNFLVVVAAVVWMRAAGITLSHVGFGALRPRRLLLMWVVATIAVDSVALGAATPILSNVFGEAPQVDRFADVPGNLPLLLMLLPAVWLIAAFGEEFFFRGFLMTVLAQAFGGSRAAWGAAVVLQAVAFGLVHAYQGPAQAIAIGIGGAVYGAMFLASGRNLWPVMLAHGINDTLGFVLLYAGVIQQ